MCLCFECSVLKKKKDYLKIEKSQYKALKITYNSSESYEELLTRSNEV